MLKLNVGANRKVQGNEQSSSRGFSCNLEVELADGLLNDTPALRAKIEELFTEARDAVEKQINGNGAKQNPKGKPATANGGNGDDEASQKQLSYLMSLGRQKGDVAAAAGRTCPEARRQGRHLQAHKERMQQADRHTEVEGG